MGITNKYQRISVDAIKINREERQRSKIDVSNILDSIRARGVLQPIIVQKIDDESFAYLLIAGERRLTASIELGLDDIPARFVEDLTETERQIIELEENIKRSDLSWQDEVKAAKRIHQLYQAVEPGWTMEKTADSVGLGKGVISIMCRVAEELSKNNPAIAAATSYRAAYNVIARKDDRAIDDAMNDLMAPPPSPAQPTKPGETPKPSLGVLPVKVDSIINQSFLSWAPSYDGPPFNFLHCDFPYGIGLHNSEQAGTGTRHEGYEDSEETYWELCSCLADNIERLMTQSSHILFWLSSDIERQHETIQFFRRAAPSLIFQTVPLTWHKTDNKGILPDPKRGPRRVTETALIGARGDRLITRAVSNAYGSPTTKEIHQSEKPEPMLRHFFQMFVDENTRLLDPTAGSGTSLRAAESLGAAHVFGLEINPDYCESANVALKKFRNLRSIKK